MPKLYQYAETRSIHRNYINMPKSDQYA